MSTSTIDWNSIPAHISGEAWLAVHEGKAQTRKQAMKIGWTVTTEEDKHFDGFVTPLSIDDETDDLTSLHEAIEAGDFEPAWQKICGLGEFDKDKEELRERLLKQCSPRLVDMLDQVGETWATMIPGLKKESADSLDHRLRKKIREAQNNGASREEVIKLVERRLSKYFPIVKKASSPRKKARAAQRDLFDVQEGV